MHLASPPRHTEHQSLLMYRSGPSGTSVADVVDKTRETRVSDATTASPPPPPPPQGRQGPPHPFDFLSAISQVQNGLCKCLYTRRRASRRIRHAITQQTRASFRRIDVEKAQQAESGNTEKKVVLMGYCRHRASSTYVAVAVICVVPVRGWLGFARAVYLE